MKTMSKLAIVLVLSLTLNLSAVGSYIYERFWRIPQHQLEELTQTLQLQDEQIEALRELRTSARSDLMTMLVSIKPRIHNAVEQMQKGKAEDPELERVFRDLSETRLQIQLRLIRKIIAFRDTLESHQREKYEKLARQRGFFRKLLGLEPLGD